MSKTLLIRQLSTGAIKALDRYKEDRGLNVNTDAAMKMMEQYWSLYDERLKLRGEMNLLEACVSRLIASIHQKGIAEESYDRALSQLKSMMLYEGDD